LEDASFEASDLAQPAQDLKLTVHTSAPFGREGGEGIAANRAVVNAAFSPEVLDEGANSTAIELDPETVVVLRAKEHRKPEQLPLESVEAAIRTQLAKEHASEAAKTRADELIASLREGKTPLAKAVDGQNWKVVEAATRSQEGIDPAVLQALFRMPKPESKDKPTFTSVTLPDGNLMLVQLRGVNEAAAPTDAEKAEYRRYLASRVGQQDFAAYRKQLESEADIKRY
jgi:peptidyl-prolyl cis-trans isomerase D